MVEFSPHLHTNDNRIGFEELISETANRFASMEPASIDAEINLVLERIGEFIGGDRAFLFALDDGGKRHRVTHLWTVQAVPAERKKAILDSI